MTDSIKEAFSKVKQDIFVLQAEIDIIKREVLNLKRTHEEYKSQQTNRQINTTEESNRHTSNTSPTDISTHNLPLEALKSQYTPISTGNEGVPTDKQTNRQTDNSTGNEGVPTDNLSQKFVLNNNHLPKESKITHLEKISEFLDSLDDIKKDLRQKLKRLTKQEMLVFSTIYQLEEEGFIVDYSVLSQKLNLTESSIRDYTQRIIKKGLPLEKIKENNKKVLISLSSNLRKIATLQTILQLREI